MGISSILDISSFFIGMIINLIFVALMCYYFKRKYDYLEMAQTEQAKILYQMIHKNAECPVDSKECSKECAKDYSKDPLVCMDLDSDSDDDSIESNENENEIRPIEIRPIEIRPIEIRDNEVGDNEVRDNTVEANESRANDIIVLKELSDPIELNIRPVEHEAEPRMESEVTLDMFEITVQMNEPENAYSKMSMKQLKEILSSKGIRAKNNIKKDELIELISKEA